MAYYISLFNRMEVSPTMTVKLDIPDDRLGAFQRLRRQLPLEMREDEEVLKKMLIYLKVGGERLVRQFVTTQKSGFPEDTLLFKPRVVEEVPEIPVAAAEPADAQDDGQDDAETGQ